MYKRGHGSIERCEFRKYTPITMKLYFVDDGSLIIVELNFDRTKVLATTLIPPGQFEVVRSTGCNYLSNLSGKEAYDLLTTEYFSYPENLPLDNLSLNGRKSDHEQVGTTDKCNK